MRVVCSAIERAHRCESCGVPLSVRIDASRLQCDLKLCGRVYSGRYKSLCKVTWPSWRGNPRDGVIQVIKALKLKGDEFKIGKTKVFIRHPFTVFAVESAYQKRLQTIAATIQVSFWGSFWFWFTCSWTCGVIPILLAPAPARSTCLLFLMSFRASWQLFG